MAEHKDIFTDIKLDIPNELVIDSLELAMVLSNLLENAIHGCDILTEGTDKYHAELFYRVEKGVFQVRLLV